MVEIRPLRVEDAPALAALHLAVWRSAYGGLVPAEAFDQVDLDERAERWRQTARGVADPPRSALVAAEPDGLVGFVAFGSPRVEVPTGTGEILALYVDERRWGSDIGHLLLSAGRRGLAEAGHDQLYLWVLEDNPRARRFYERSGLSHDGTRMEVDLFGTPLQELRYVGPTVAPTAEGGHSSP